MVSRRDWRDLAESSPADPVVTDVCIIGAGAAGIYLATELSRRGVATVVVEAGGYPAESADRLGFEPSFGLDPYPGAIVGRAFGMGGSTSRWGGVLVPHATHDLRTGDPNELAWRTIVARVVENARAVLSRLGFEGEPNFEGYPLVSNPAVVSALAHTGIDVHANLILPFRLKNLSFLWRDASVLHLPRVFLNATAKSWTLTRGSDGRFAVIGLQAVSRVGNSVSVAARRFVIAAGAIESARILLELDRASRCQLFSMAASPGSSLTDHVSLPIADVAAEHFETARELFAPRFESGWMRSFRLLIRPQSSDEPRGFGHFIFEQDAAGFRVAKELLASLQARRRPRLSIRECLRGVSGLSSLAYDRVLRSRLHVPRGSSVRLQLDMEQVPSSQNRLTLGDEVDAYGRPRLKVDWSVSDRDIAVMAEMGHRLLSSWSAGVGGLLPLVPRRISAGVGKPYDAYHPAGTCRMGEGDGAVVDLDLRVIGASNLWVVSTGVLPSAGTANPTFSMLCLAHGLAARLERTS